MTVRDRLVHLVAGHGPTLAVALAVVGALLLGVGASDYLQPETTQVTDNEDRRTFATELHSSAVVTGNSSLYEQGTRLEGPPVYFVDATPTLDLAVETATPEGTVHVDRRLTLVYTATRGGDTFWRDERVLAADRTNVTDGRATLRADLDATAVRDRLSRIRDEVAGAGTVDAHLAVRVTYRTDHDEGALEADTPIRFGGNSYRVRTVGDERTHSTPVTRTVVVPAGDPTESLLWLVLGVAGLGGGALTGGVYWRRYRHVDPDALALRIHRGRYAEWISTGDAPVDPSANVVSVTTLEDLVDVAIDSDARVIHDTDRGVYVVFVGSVVYRFVPPEAGPDEAPGPDQVVDDHAGTGQGSPEPDRASPGTERSTASADPATTVAERATTGAERGSHGDDRRPTDPNVYDVGELRLLAAADPPDSGGDPPAPAIEAGPTPSVAPAGDPCPTASNGLDPAGDGSDRVGNGTGGNGPSPRDDEFDRSGPEAVTDGAGCPSTAGLPARSTRHAAPDPVTPTDSADPVTPTGSADPVTPTDAIDSTAPADATDFVGSSTPADASEPTTDTEPTMSPGSSTDADSIVTDRTTAPDSATDSEPVFASAVLLGSLDDGENPESAPVDPEPGESNWTDAPEGGAGPPSDPVFASAVLLGPDDGPDRAAEAAVSADPDDPGWMAVPDPDGPDRGVSADPDGPDRGVSADPDGPEQGTDTDPDGPGWLDLPGRDESDRSDPGE